MNRTNWKSLLISLALSIGTGVLASLITADEMIQYRNMYNPPLAPPAWLFPVVWTLLYFLMGVSAYLIYESDSAQKASALRIYALQLAANFLWSILFFGLNAYLLAFTWLLLLWYLIYMTYKQFSDINQTAANLLIPYLFWVSFAAYLNLSIALYYQGI